jgi:predicted DCC family thiol-disulfide oxidoreductase YuxK
MPLLPPPRAWAPLSAAGIPDDTILFDGVCVLCSGWVRFVAARDGGRFSFVPVQSPYGRILAERLGISADMPESNAVVLGGVAHFKSDAAVAVLSLLPSWDAARMLGWMPRRLRDTLYDRVAQNRYRLFGRTDACMVPPPGLARRVLYEAPS